MTIKDIKKLNIPNKSGCYQFFDKDKKIIYVGKAVNLRNRIVSYWQKGTAHTSAKYAMLKKIYKIRWIETDSEIEALLLEANLIKKHQPQFNIVMRDDERHVYIKVSTEEKWPRVFMARNLEKSGKYFGPFVSTEAVIETLKVIRKIWPYRSCVHLPEKVCLYYRIGRCQGMCEDKISENDYQKIIKQIILFLEGKKQKVIKEMEKEIKSVETHGGASLVNDARILKYQLINLNKVLAHANILSLTDKYAADVVELAKVLGLAKIPERIEGYDISNIFGNQAVGSMVVFAGGEPSKKDYRKFKIKIGQGKASDTGMLREVLERRLKRSDANVILNEAERNEESHSSKGGEILRYAQNDKNFWPDPDLIIIDGGKGQLNTVLSIFKKNKIDTPVLAVSKGAGLRSAMAPDKIFFPGEKKPLELPLSSPALHIIKRVRDEAHRFAVKYHRELKRKNMLR